MRQERVMQLLREHPEGMTCRQMLEADGGFRDWERMMMSSAVYSRCATLKKQGYVRSVKLAPNHVVWFLSDSALNQSP